jgi:hypothetical protein
MHLNHHALGLVVDPFSSRLLQTLGSPRNQPDRRFLRSGIVITWTFLNPPEGHK